MVERCAGQALGLLNRPKGETLSQGVANRHSGKSVSNWHPKILANSTKLLYKT
jgi:hypothetical protein